MTKEGRLTKRQKEILEYIKKYSAQKKYPPSIREISANFNLYSGSFINSENIAYGLSDIKSSVLIIFSIFFLLFT